jgi:uncharacterized protein YggE
MIFAITVLSAAGGAAQEPSGVPYITVSGFAEDWVDPDVAVWAIRIQNDGKELRQLKLDNDAEFERVLKVAYALEVAREHVIAGRIGVTNIHKTDKHGRRGEFSHFRLTREVKIEQHDIGRFEEFLDELLMDGALNVRLTYNLTTAPELLHELKLEAVRAARSKAHQMAGELDSELGEPLIISEYPILTDYAQIDHLSKQSGRIIRSTPERVHLQQRVYLRFALAPREDQAASP